MLNKGFTLIELLVVVSIISLLASIIIVATDSARINAKFAAVKEGVRTISTEIEINRSNNDYFSVHNESDCNSATGIFDLDVVDDAIAQIGSELNIDLGSDSGCFMELDPNYWTITFDADSVSPGKLICANQEGVVDIYDGSVASEQPCEMPVS